MKIKESHIKKPSVKQQPEKVLEIKIELAHGKFSMEDAFELHTHAIEVGKASEVIWEGMSKEYQEVMTQILKRSLEVMHQNVDRFLPNIITGAPGDMIDISMKVLLSKIEEQVEIIQQANEFEKEAAKREMIAEIVGSSESLTDSEFLRRVEDSLRHGSHVPNEAVKRIIEMIPATEEKT